MEDISGNELIARSLVANGISYVFTTSSDRLGPLMTYLETKTTVKVIIARSEGAATLMADGYIRRSGKSAVIVTDDNGRSLEQIYGVANAWADKTPLLSLSICNDDEVDYNKGFNRYRYDQNGVYQEITIWRKRVNSIESIPDSIKKGIVESTRQKRGPVHIDIPFGLLEKTASFDVAVFSTPASIKKNEMRPARLAGDERCIEKAASSIKNAKKPFIFCGGGVKVSEAYDEVIRFIEEFKIPAATTMGGFGSIPLDHEYCLGGPAYTSGEAFHVAIHDADVVIALGVSFCGLDGFGLPPLWSEKIKFIHVDIDPLQIGLNVSPEISILGDVKTVLDQLTEQLRSDGFTSKPAWRSWVKYLSLLKEGRYKRLNKFTNKKWPMIQQGKVIEELGKVIKRDDLVLVMDGGNTPVFFAMHAPSLGPRQSFYPFGMAAIGCGIPYAIGVQLASPGKRVMLITGDGSFLYHVQELETICRLNLPIMIIISNDSAWNMIRAMQYFMFGGNFVGTTLPDIDYAKIGRGFGLHATRVGKASDILPAYEKGVNTGRAALIDIITDKNNFPDCLASFSLIEFDGLLKLLNPIKLLKSSLLIINLGWSKLFFNLTYIRKALLRINIRAKWRS
ncbi:MAG: thiamine pyrophosphate-binding protein [Candidatus Brocadiaceae bacterium]|nr:thiamine pyrophosphate-binding protein [Candidatus Brocadiaceae bacterium]